ncbi:MAG: hypothetical protein F4Y33_13670 [Gemmatimonadales bacterium]|nr:hypothetical protein [Gemmatimonadales bacterium]
MQASVALPRGASVHPARRPAAARAGSATWAAPATCGELVQGFGRGRWLQIAAPVDLYRAARAEVVSPAHAEAGASRRHAKVKRGLEVLLRERPGRALRVMLGGDELPRASGFGSSTADLGAALRAGVDALGLRGSDDAVVSTALQVEPTGGSLLPGLVLFDHRRGTIREPLGPPPALNILCFRVPGAVDTVAFNRGLPTRLPEHVLKVWRDAFRLCAEGIAHGDPGKIGAAATASAAAALRLGCSPAPPGLEVCARETTALGILRAHSGTVWGLLYPKDETPVPGEVSEILNRGGPVTVPVLPARSSAMVASLRLIGGGCRVAPPSDMRLSSQIDARGPPEVRSETDAAPPL